MRILSVLNFSNWRNPAADSGVRLQSELLRAVARKRSDCFFYLLIPKELECEIAQDFTESNVQLIPTTSISRQQGGAHHLDLRELETLLNLRRIDIDVLFINQPELTAGLLEFFNKVHFFDLHSFNYVHWMDWRRNDTVKNRWNLPGNLALLTSVLLSEVTGCNSVYGKSKIIKEAKRWFNEPTVAEIERKLVPVHPGIDVAEICSCKVRKRHRVKTIIYPFRALKYTGFRAFIDHMSALWQKRQDFRVIVTNPSNYDYIKKVSDRLPFVEVAQFDRARYLQELWMADIVVACHTGASQWSLAAAEALAAECVPLFNSESFLGELMSAALPTGLPQAISDRYFYYRSEFPKRLEYLLDNLDAERKLVRPLAAQIRDYYDWDSRVDDWIRCLEQVDRVSPALRGRTDASHRIDAILSAHGSVSKEDLMRQLGWHIKSRHISWTRYRKYLRANYVDDHGSPYATFSVRRKPKRPAPRPLP